MKYDFESIIDRRGLDASAVDVIGHNVPWAAAPKAPREGFTPIPMWVADMNFATVPTIQEAVGKRLSHPLYGYFNPRSEYFEAIRSWQHDRNGMDGIEDKMIGYENGVLGCVSSAIRAFTLPGEKILIHSPTYIGFSHVLEDTCRIAEHSPLKRDEHGIWRMDYEDMAERIEKNHIRLAIFCSPHNPCGRVWERWEIEKAMDVYRKYNVIVISDEIWSDIILDGNHHIPTQSVSKDARERTIAVYAPSKTFNLAGLVGSYHIIYNDDLRNKVLAQSALTHYNSMNVLSMYALIGAYTPEGRAWTDELCEVLSDNVSYAYNFICENFNGVSIAKPQGTYMLFINCERYCKSRGITIQQLIEAGWDVGVAWQDGTQFLDPWSIRINLAVPFTLVKEAMNRLKEYVFL